LTIAATHFAVFLHYYAFLLILKLLAITLYYATHDTHTLGHYAAIDIALRYQLCLNATLLAIGPDYLADAFISYWLILLLPLIY